MQRVAPNTIKEGFVKVVIPKQSSQPNINPESNTFFHIAPKFQQQRLTIKQTVPTSKSIEEKRCKQHKNNLSENNNSTNSNSKSRVIATLQIEDDSLQTSQNGLKLRKIVADSHLFSTNVLQQLSKQNLNTNLTNDSQSPGQRKPIQINQELYSLNTQIQSFIIKKKYHTKWEIYKELLLKQCNLLNVYKHQFIQSTSFNDISVRIINNLFEMMNNISIEILCEQESKFNQIIEKINQEKELCLNNCQIIEKERDLLIQTVNQLKSPKQINNSNQIDSLDTGQLQEMQNAMQFKLQEISEKEAKLIKLVLAIKRSGIDIEKIYNEEVLNDDSALEPNDILHGVKHYNFEKNEHDADNSIVNDSDESSFCFLNKLENDSILDSIRQYQYKSNKNLDTKTNNVKLKLDLSSLQQKFQQTQKKQQHNKSQSSQIIQNKQQKHKIPENQSFTGFHQEFIQKLNEFSESWRIQAAKDEKRTKS
ncbi:unnamed protein product (macronuclear) [Paramecium tetraurelia]|uniref:Uncharacterized protein n=1 Tax=Paramecium tetraurelia TaxID=5888 RepID=A0DJF0_PARTE|nr:uncharacterized protein GSPATT00017511001 [Paramecium tetraurelia]CAK83167.1 unnamed protein product [Paramecium tetraurelia]|eukprot:XP_001450564.1 hypothetical protein (macronuclear) [Paramecium tetraurelia strain d4-2]